MTAGKKKVVWIVEYVDNPHIGNHNIHNFNSMHRGKFVLLSRVFSKEVRIIQRFWI